MKVKHWLTTLIVVGLLAVVFFWPLPAFIESPGSANHTDQVITVNHHRKSSPLLFTTVQVMQATPITWLIAHVLPYHEVLSQQDLMADDNTTEYAQMQKYYMRNASNNAIAAAFKEIHRPVKQRYQGVYVLAVLKNSHFRHFLQVGDVITKVNGHAFQSSQGLMHYIQRKKATDQVVVTYQHRGRSQTARQKLMRLPNEKKSGLGIQLVDKVQVQTNPQVKVNAGSVGGPSAGLMFTLQIYEQLTQQNLTHGQIVAGTGTITPQGQVGPIGGIDKKVVAADRKGAKIFLTPRDPVTPAKLKLDSHYQSNYQLAKKTAQKLHSSMKVVPISNLKQAIHYLKTHP